MPRQPQEIIIQGSTLNHIAGNYIDRPNIIFGSGIQALSQAISHGAMHDAAERDPPPRCHPGTRKKASEDIVRWIEEPNPSSSVLWVNGRAGVGKTALMQKIAERGGVYFGGCFFFRRGVPGCNQKGSLFSTLAYQLAMNIPGMLEHVEGAMLKDFSLPTKSAAVQIQRLIVEPLKLLPIPPHIRIIIIDGLDECEGVDSQCDILSLVSQLLMDPSVPMRFIIASRPEHQICSTFNKGPLISMTRRLILDDEYDSASDIERYLRDKFAEIHTCNRDVMRRVESPWPSEDDLLTLVARASGQFIYVSTVVKFVGSVTDFLSPQEKLKVILNPDPIQASAFAELDRLYTQILSGYGDSEVLVRILSVVIGLELQSDTDPWLSIPAITELEVIADIAGLGEDKVHLVLRALQSLTKVHTKAIYDDHHGEPNGMIYHWVELSHRSFHDFLTDKERSGPYFINTNLFIGQIFCRVFELATVSIEKFKSSGSFPKTSVQTWLKFETIIGRDYPSRWTASEKSELCVRIKDLRATLFNDQILSSNHSFEFLAALIPILHCICVALYYIRDSEILGFLSSPENPDPLQLRNFHFDTRNILDEYYRLVLASPTIGPVPIPMYIATDFAVRPKTLVEVSRISNIPTPHILNLKSFLQQYSFLCRTTCILGTRKLVLAYSSPCELRNFFFDPGRSRHLYPVSWIIGKCWEAIEYMSQTRPLANTHSNPPEVGSLVYGLSHFFKGSERNGHFSGASHMLSAVRTEAEDEYLLRFLVFLCRIPWLNFCLELDGSAAIAQWALESSSLQCGKIQDALHKLFIEIVPRGILPALRAHNFWFKESGILDSGCLERHWISRGLVWPMEHIFEEFLELLSACTTQQCFGLFCTTMVETLLFREVYWTISNRKYQKPTCIRRCSEVQSDPALISDYLDIGRKFAFSYASLSSKNILVALRWLHQAGFNPCPGGCEARWIVGEAIDWLKNQTADPQPQCEVIKWMEGLYTEVEKKESESRKKGN